MRIGIIIILFFTAFAEVFSSLPSKVNTASEASLGNFYQSVSEYFKASQKELLLVRESNLSNEEIPVVYFISRSAKINVEDVINMRSCGQRWMDIAKYYELDPKIFSDIACSEAIHCKKHECKVSSKKIGKIKNLKRLNDQQIQALVNIKFISEDHLCSSAYVKKLRKAGIDFVSINDQIIQEHREHLEELRSKNIEGLKVSGIQN